MRFKKAVQKHCGTWIEFFGDSVNVIVWKVQQKKFQKHQNLRKIVQLFAPSSCCLP